MRKVIKKNYFAWQAEEEEKWINEMSAEGWQLVAVGWFRYEFEKGEPNEYQYRLELLEHWPKNPKSVEYIRFIEDTGAECFATIKNWAYFRRKTADGPFELFSDIKGKLTLNKRYLQLLGVCFCFEVAYLPPALVMAFTHRAPSLMLIVAFNAVIAVMMGRGITKILRKCRELRRQQTIME